MTQGLFTNWGIHNKVMDEGMVTSYSKERKSKNDWEYFEYTRTRTMKYEYVGMDYETALSCANYYSNYYVRPYIPLIWDDENHIWVYDSPSNDRFERVNCGSVNCIHVDGQMWKVSISLGETITQPYRPLNNQLKYPQTFTEFESNPSRRDLYFFKGYDYGSVKDFLYDEYDQYGNRIGVTNG